MSSPRPENRAEDDRSKPKPFSVSLPSSSTNGAKKPSFKLQSSSRSSNAPGGGGGLPRRSRHLQDHDDSGEEEAAPVHEEVTGFDTSAGGAISKDGAGSREKAPLVIKVASKNNWRDRPGVNRAVGGKNLLPPEVQAQRNGQAGQAVVESEGPNMSSGLSYAQPRAAGTEEANGGDVHMAEANATYSANTDEKPKKLTQDEIALQALIRDSKEDGQGRRSDLVIESAKLAADGDAGDYKARYDESSSFRADVATRPDPASLEDYNAIPVEEFGAALLRGMGWKDGQSIGRNRYGDSPAGTQARIPERRPGFLGIGAKDVGNGKGAEVEIGAWGKAAMRKGSRKNNGGADGGNTEGVYMPVVMKSKTTGELITEDQLKLRQTEAKNQKADDEWRERRDRNLEKSGRDRRRDDHDEHDRDRRDRRHNGSSRKDRSRSSDPRSRRYEHDDDYDDDGSSGRDSRRYRDRDRDRERYRDRKYRDSPRSRDDERYSSSRHSSSTPSRRDRDRDYDRGRDRDRHRDGDRNDRD